MSKKDKFGFLDKAVETAELKNSKAKSKSKESKNILLKIPIEWENRIKENSLNLNVSNYIRVAISEKLDRDGL